MIEDEFMLDEFKVEAAEMFEEAEQGLLSIDRGEDFFNNYNSIFRAFHSLKGAAGMFGIDKLQAHMHKLESFFESLKDESYLTKEEVDYFLDGVDASKALLDGQEIDFQYMTERSESGGEETKVVNDKTTEEVKPSVTPINKAKRLENIEKKSEHAGVIFIVDDEPDIVDIIVSILTKENYEIHKFTEASKLISALDDVKPDCILSDIKMPDLDGMQMLEKISEIAENVPVIFISAYITKDIMIKGLSNGAYGFIDKPFEETFVIPIVRNAVNRRQALKLLTKSIDYILYQFSDLDTYLKETGKESVRQTLKTDISNILEQRKILVSVK